MHRLAFLLPWLFLTAAVSAQQLLGFPPGTFTNRAALDAASAPSYTGPGDVVAGAATWWGLRAYSAAYAAGLGKLANICTPADAVCADVNSDASGNFNLSGTGSLLCNNSTSICTIKTLYDQSGNSKCGGPCDVTNSTIADRPTLVISCIGSLVCAQFAGSQFLTSPTGFTQAQPWTVSVVVNETSGSFDGFMGDGGGNAGGAVYQVGIGYGIEVAANNAIGINASQSAWHAENAAANGASSVVNVDGTEVTGNVGSSAGFSSTILRVGLVNGWGNLTGFLNEGGFWSGVFSSGQRTSMCNNQFTYWGTSVAC